MTCIKQNDIHIRKIQKSDGKQLQQWLSNPDVLAYYEGRDQAFTLEKVRRKFLSPGDPIIRFIVEYEGSAIGYAQMYEVNADSSNKKFGMDQFIGEPSYWNKGIGTQFISAMVIHITEKCGGRIIQVDPHVTNLRAIRCYEKCGFQKVRVLLNHEFHEGAYKDCWLMEYKYE